MPCVTLHFLLFFFFFFLFFFFYFFIPPRGKGGVRATGFIHGSALTKAGATVGTQYNGRHKLIYMYGQELIITNSANAGLMHAVDWVPTLCHFGMNCTKSSGMQLIY